MSDSRENNERSESPHEFHSRRPVQNGWNEWSRFVLKELERQDDELQSLSKRCAGHDTALAVLSLKIGLISGGISATVALIATFVARHV